MRKKIYSLIFLTFIMLFFGSVKYGECKNPKWDRWDLAFKDFTHYDLNNEAEYYNIKLLREEKLKFLMGDVDDIPRIPEIITLADGETKVKLEWDVSIAQGFPIYGGPASIKEGSYPIGFALATQKYKDANEEPRFLGYTMLGDPITNMWFEPDSEWSRQHTTPFEPAIDDFSFVGGANGNLHFRDWVKLSPGGTNPPTSYNIWDGVSKTGDNRDWNVELFGGDTVFMDGTAYPDGALAKGYGFKKAYDDILKYYGNGSTTFENFKDGNSMTNYFAVVSPYSSVTPLIMVGKFGGGAYYRTYIVYPDLANDDPPPLIGVPDLAITIEPKKTDDNPNGYPGNLNSGKTFKALVKIKLNNPEKFPENWDPVAQPIIYSCYYYNGGPAKLGEITDFLTTDIINEPDHTLEFFMDWKGDYSDELVFEGYVNPKVFPEDLPHYGPTPPSSVVVDKQVIADSPYDNNAYRDSLILPGNAGGLPGFGNGGGGSVSCSYKGAEYWYDAVKDPPIEVNMNTGDANDKHRIFTYKPNIIKMETSLYTEKVEITFNKDGNGKKDELGNEDNKIVKIILYANNDDYNSGNKSYNSSPAIEKYIKDGATWKKLDSGNQDYIYADTLSVKRETVSIEKKTETYVLTEQAKKVWTINFSVKNYAIYGHPYANETLFDYIKFEAFDHNNQNGWNPTQIKAEYEDNPIYYYVNVRQSKLFNLRVNDVKDIYWKNIFVGADNKSRRYTDPGDPNKKDNQPPFGIGKMPITGMSLSNDRLISKGYSVQLEIDSEGMQKNDKLIVKPYFWWYNGSNFEPVDLYYDVTNQDIINVPIEDDTSKLEEKLEKMRNYFKSKGLSDSKIEKIEQDVKKNMISTYSRLEINSELKYYKNQVDESLLLSGRNGIWDYGNNTVADPSDNYYTKFENYRNTWTFTYSLHPKVKAFKKDANPFIAKPLTGSLLVTFKIIGYADHDKKWYNYTANETSWDTSPRMNAILRFSNGWSTGDLGKPGHGHVFYYNLDWSVLDDYTSNQKW